MRKTLPVLALSLALTSLTSCSAIMYSTMELFGKEKRDFLISAIEKAKDSQQVAQEQFQSTLEKLSSLVNVEDSELKTAYKRFADEYETCESRAKNVRSRIQEIDSVATDLFDEWRGELDEFTDPTLRSKSETQLLQTKTNYTEMFNKMQAASSKMDPVLDKFKNRVLSLKHSLNAQVIGEIKGEFAAIEKDIATLIEDMQGSIAEADEFIKNMGS